ncbi:MAG: glycosyltransferase [Deltaproteobacteria bacterium]|jgi:glycosyltransferase involved in cell wall biosynthesis|nr:glycosyltransferase [Deltaproteobacteria bacterium]
MPSATDEIPRPLISVFMSARNASAHLTLAVSSILKQSLADFEFLVIDDASDDNTWELLNSFNDPRLRLQRNETRQGQSANYNRLVQLAKGRYLAKMDADDISLSTRFHIQVDYMEEHPEIWACSGVFKLLIGKDLYENDRVFEPDELRASFLFRNNLAHPFMMLRGDIWRKYNILYDLKSPYAQDYELWLRLMMDHPEAAFANVSEIVGIYRHHAGSISVRKMEEQKICVTRAQMNVFKKLGLSPLDPDIKYHQHLYHLSPLDSAEELAGVFAWANTLRNANSARQLFDPALFDKYLKIYLFNLISSKPRHVNFYNTLKKAGLAALADWKTLPGHAQDAMP